MGIGDMIGWFFAIGILLVFFLGMFGVFGRSKAERPREIPEDGSVSDQEMRRISPEVEHLMVAAENLGIRVDFGFMARLQRMAMLWKTSMGKNKQVTMQLEAKMREMCKTNKFELKVTDDSVIIEHKKGSIKII